MINGYTLAREIDDKISEKLYPEGVTSGNLGEWEKFIRTIRTSLDLIETEIDEKRADSEVPESFTRLAAAVALSPLEHTYPHKQRIADLKECRDKLREGSGEK